MSDINFEEDQQDLIEKTDIQTLASYCQELQQKEDEKKRQIKLVRR